MKLMQSVQPLKNWIDINSNTNVKNKMTVHLNNLKNDPKVNDYKKRFRWDLWWSIPKDQRDNIIAASIPRDNWIGGYPDINDDHIYTLLKKVIDCIKIVNIETGLIINKKGLFNV